MLTLLNDEEWSGWNNSEIARQCCVSEFLVRKMKEENKESSSIKSKIDAPQKVRRGEQEYEMDTSNIGKRDIFGKKITADHEQQIRKDNPDLFWQLIEKLETSHTLNPNSPGTKSGVFIFN